MQNGGQHIARVVSARAAVAIPACEPCILSNDSSGVHPGTVTTPGPTRLVTTAEAFTSPAIHFEPRARRRNPTTNARGRLNPSTRAAPDVRNDCLFAHLKVAPERSQCARRAAWTANRARVAAIPRLSCGRARTARQRLDHDGRLRSTDLAMALAVVKAIPAAIGPQVHRVQPFAHSNTTAPAISRFNTKTHYLTLMGRVNQDAHCSASRPAASLVV